MAGQTPAPQTWTLLCSVPLSPAEEGSNHQQDEFLDRVPAVPYLQAPEAALGLFPACSRGAFAKVVPANQDGGPALQPFDLFKAGQRRDQGFRRLVGTWLPQASPPAHVGRLWEDCGAGSPRPGLT